MSAKNQTIAKSSYRPMHEIFRTSDTTGDMTTPCASRRQAHHRSGVSQPKSSTMATIAKSSYQPSHENFRASDATGAMTKSCASRLQSQHPSDISHPKTAPPQLSPNQIPQLHLNAPSQSRTNVPCQPRIHPRRDGGAAYVAQALPHAAARPAAPQSYGLHLARSKPP